MWFICFAIEYYSATKMNEILPLVTAWKDLKGILLNEINQRKANIICFHLYMESKKQNKHISQNRNRLTDTENKLIFARGEGDGNSGGD